MIPRVLWVVEIWNPAATCWEPTIGCRFSRAEGRRELADWRRARPVDRFQLVKYEVTR